MTSTQNEVRLVGIMGETGAGKSSFINSILGYEAAVVSDGVLSCTRTVESFDYEREDGLTVTLVDTPGFNDYDDMDIDSKTDAEILQMIADFLKSEYAKERKFTGIVFLHSIAKPPVTTTRKNMKMFKRLCGEGGIRNVVVATTFWDRVSHKRRALQDAETDEEDLMESEGYLKELNDAGVPFVRTGQFDSSAPQPPGEQYQTPLSIVERLLGLEPVYLQFQNQMAEGKTIRETDAGLVIEEQLEVGMKALEESGDGIQKTAGYLQSATNIGDSERQQKSILLQSRIEEWERQKARLSTERELWEYDRQQTWTDIHVKSALQEREVKQLKQEAKANIQELNEARREREASLQRERQYHDKCMELQAEMMKLLRERLASDIALKDKTVELEKAEKELQETKRELEGSETEVERLRRVLNELRQEVEDPETARRPFVARIATPTTQPPFVPQRPSHHDDEVAGSPPPYCSGPGPSSEQVATKVKQGVIHLAYDLEARSRSRPSLLQESVNLELFIHVPEDIQRMPFFEQWSQEEEEEYILRVVLTIQSQATITLTYLHDCGKIGFELLESEEKGWKIRHTISPKADDFHHALHHLCRYYYHRDRASPTLEDEMRRALISSHFMIDAFRLRVDEDGSLVPSGPKLNVEGTGIELTIGPNDQDDRYGFKISNFSHLNVHPYLFYFSDSDFSIVPIHQTPIKGSSKDLVVPSLVGQSYLTFGYGSEGAVPQALFLSDNKTREQGFLRLYLSTEHVDLSSMEQVEISKQMGRGRQSADLGKSSSSQPVLDCVTIPVLLRRGEGPASTMKHNPQDMQTPFKLRTIGEVSSRIEPQQTPVTHRVACFAAIDALEHLQTHRNDIIQAMANTKTPVAALAGFNEDLIAEDTGVFLQEIHIISSENLTLEQHVLDAVGKACSPFPSMIFMPSGETIRPPVFNADGKTVNLEDLIPPSSASQPRFNIALDKAQTLVVDDSGDHGRPPSDATQGQDRSPRSSGSSTTPRKAQNRSNIIRRGSSDNDPQPGEEGSHAARRDGTPRNTTAGEGDSAPIGDTQSGEQMPPSQGPPEPGDGSTTQRPRTIYFVTLAQIHQPRPGSGPFQQILLDGGFNFELTPGRSLHLEFTKMQCQSHSIADVSYRYFQSHLKILIDTYNPRWRLSNHKPKSTRATDGQVKSIETEKTGWQQALKAGLSVFPFGVNVKVEGTHIGEHARANEVIYYSSRIIQRQNLRMLWWSFHVDDPNEKDCGVELTESALPSAEISVLSSGSSHSPNPTLDKLTVEITSFWSLLKKGRGGEWFSFALGKSLPPGLSNLCQVICFDLPPHDGHYISETHVGARAAQEDPREPPPPPVSTIHCQSVISPFDGVLMLGGVQESMDGLANAGRRLVGA
ncbi:hypothetical protein H1R20_g2336, partial [Candolleomyces eurysporus]